MDNWLAQNFNGYLQYCASVIGTFFLVTYSFPWLAFMFIPIIGFFVRHNTTHLKRRLIRQLLTAAYYTRTNRETKRVESLLRSFVYSSLQEQVSDSNWLH
jgi:ATP-binding cassette subfamily C (CFTR/MRP) protein 1